MPNREEEANHAPRKLTWREKTRRPAGPAGGREWREPPKSL